MRLLVLDLKRFKGTRYQGTKVEDTEVRRLFIEVISQEARLNRYKLSSTDVIRGQNGRNNAVVCYLWARKEVANCGSRFSGFKAKNILRRFDLKVKNNRKATKKIFRI